MIGIVLFYEDVDGSESGVWRYRAGDGVGLEIGEGLGEVVLPECGGGGVGFGGGDGEVVETAQDGGGDEGHGGWEMRWGGERGLMGASDGSVGDMVSSYSFLHRRLEDLLDAGNCRPMACCCLMSGA